MTTLTDIIAKQEAKVDKLRHELRTAEEVLGALKEIGVDQPSSAPQLRENPSATDSLIDLSVIQLPDTVRSARRIDDVRDVVGRFGAQEFTAALAEAAMRKQGVSMPTGKNPRAKISMLLAELAGDGFLTKTVTGGGNVPARYKLTSALSQEDLAMLQKQKTPGPITAGLGL
jgi:hypothetical protein